MNNKNNITIAAALALTIAIFIVDLRLPVDYADWLLYFIPFFLAAKSLKSRYLPLLAVVMTFLITASYFLSPPGGAPVRVAANCAMGILVLWWLTFIIRKREQAEDALTRSYQELEQRVRDRTAELSRANTSLTTEIAERTRIEEEQKRTMEELKRSNRELDEFARVVSHDLREPLRSVSGFAELLAHTYGEKLDATADQYLSSVIGGADRMAALINDLLQYSRVSAQGTRFTNVEMSAVLDTATENLKQALKEKNAVLTRDSLPAVLGDKTQLVQLLQNLIGNAVKFGKKDVRPGIHVSAERKDDEWVFGVQDNGIGIDPAFHEKVFAIFQRLHTREEYPGTGIGLAICMKIVERHGGRIWIESKTDEGATFYFTLRAAA